MRSVLRESRPGFPARGHDSESKRMLHTIRAQYEAGLLPKEEYERFASFVESSLDVLAHISEGATDTAPVEAQENKCADGSSSACPLVVEDGNRKTLMCVKYLL